MTDATRLKSTIYIGGLDNSITKPLLHAAFLPFGEIVEVNLPGSENERGHRGFGYVEFESAEDAAAAIDNMDQATLAGRTLSVAIAKPQTKEAGNVLGSKVAVWEQEDWIRKYEVSEEDRAAAETAKAEAMAKAVDPMQGLEGLDVAGPKPASE